MTNAERAATVTKLLPSIRRVLGVDLNEPDEQNVRDILTNIMHWFDSREQNCTNHVKMAIHNYTAEVYEELLPGLRSGA